LPNSIEWLSALNNTIAETASGGSYVERWRFVVNRHSGLGDPAGACLQSVPIAVDVSPDPSQCPEPDTGVCCTPCPNSPSPTPTSIVVANNVIYGDLCYNQSYQAGISDVGNGDRMINNTIYGPGYTACATGTPIDVSDATDSTVRNRPLHLPRPHDD
jgi:hypothetical protein